tara:strand:+ start:1027 stop:1401 length:375 start_codon:yes stop_codon:yes gene_type:complete
MPSEVVDPTKPFSAEIPENLQATGGKGVLEEVGKHAGIGGTVGSFWGPVGTVIGTAAGVVTGLTVGLVKGAQRKSDRKKETAKQKYNWLSMRKNMDAALRRDGSISQWDPAKTTTAASGRPTFQ